MTIQSTTNLKPLAEALVEKSNYFAELERKIQEIVNKYLDNSDVSDLNLFALTQPLIQLFQNSFIEALRKNIESLPNNDPKEKSAEEIFARLKNIYNLKIKAIALNLSGKLCDTCLAQNL